MGYRYTETLIGNINNYDNLLTIDPATKLGWSIIDITETKPCIKLSGVIECGGQRTSRLLRQTYICRKLYSTINTLGKKTLVAMENVIDTHFPTQFTMACSAQLYARLEDLILNMGFDMVHPSILIPTHWKERFTGNGRCKKSECRDELVRLIQEDHVGMVNKNELQTIINLPDGDTMDTPDAIAMGLVLIKHNLRTNKFTIYNKEIIDKEIALLGIQKKKGRKNGL